MRQILACALLGLLAAPAAAETEPSAACLAAADRMTAAFFAALKAEAVAPRPGADPADAAAALGGRITDPQACALVMALSDGALILMARRVIRDRAKPAED